MKRAKMIKMIKEPPTRPSANEVEYTLETLQDLSMFSTLGDEIRSLVLNMESLLVRERIDNLKQSVVCNWLFQKKIKEKKSFSKPPVVNFHYFYQTFRKLELSVGRTFLKVPWEIKLSRVNRSLLFNSFYCLFCL